MYGGVDKHVPIIEVTGFKHISVPMQHQNCNHTIAIGINYDDQNFAVKAYQVY